MRSSRIRVLIVDDSALVRKMLSNALARELDIEVVGMAEDAYVARNMVLELRPDVITLDIEMPRMDGITFLRKLMQYKPLPVIIISSLGHSACQASLDALRAGAVEILAKPAGPSSVGDLGRTLADKIRIAAASRPRMLPARHEAAPTPLPPTAASSRKPSGPRAISGRILAIGASTGGPAAIAEVLRALPADSDPILVVQHMPAVFTRHFAERLDRECRVAVKEAEDGDELMQGRALIAPGDLHMVVERAGPWFRVKVGGGPPVSFSRPSVDVLFSSLAAVAGRDAIGVLLTGMGADGARGLLAMREAGATTIAQDADSCVVFGMPKEAIRLGAAELTLPLEQIAGAISHRGLTPTQ